MAETSDNLLDCFRVVRDPRIERTKKHPLESILFIAICGVICGAESFTEIEQFAHEKQEWLQRYVRLPHGIPSHDTLGRVFALLDPAEFQDCFLRWIRSLYQPSAGEVIAVDGKTLRRAHGGGLEVLHVVQAWASENHLMLGALKSEGGRNEILTIPKLLKLLDLKGAIVTLDAMGTQVEIARALKAKQADYVMSLKGNQEWLHEKVKACWKDEKFKREADHYEVREQGHGRMEQRRYWMSSQIPAWPLRPDWIGLFQSIGMVESSRTLQERTTHERRYYVSSLPADAKELAKAVRGHWGIENGLHWVLDIAFREDECRVRIGHAAENFALLRRLAVNLLKRETSVKIGIKAKRMKAGWGTAYLEKVLWSH